MRPCPCCEAEVTEPLLSTRPVPVQTAVLVKSLADSLAVPRRPIVLQHCPNCGFLWNTAFEAGLVRYDSDYEGTQAHSPVFRSYLSGLARQWLGALPQTPMRVVEAGCGQGEFLAELSHLSAAELQGFDPAYRGEGQARVTIEACELPDGDASADMVVNRMTLEHVFPPLPLLAAQASWLSRMGILFTQVPNAAHMLAAKLPGDLVYEHCNYFTARSLWHLLVRAGLAPQGLSIGYGDQHLTMSSAREGQAMAIPGRIPAGIVEAFASEMTQFGPRWGSLLAAERRAGRTPWIWGSGSRAVAFAAALPDPSVVAGAIDINPVRAGTYVPGSTWCTQPPETLKAGRSLTVVAMNPIYRTEIADRLAKLNCDAKLLAVGETSLAAAAPLGPFIGPGEI